MRRLGLALVISLLLGVGASQADDDRQAGPPVALQSAYQAEALLGAHVIRIRGHLGGEGEIELDPNRCELDPFGDARACTEMAPRRVAVKFRRAKLADPSGRNRRLFLLAGDLGQGEEVFLVVPRTDAEQARLIVGRGDVPRRVITLEALVEPAYGEAGVLCPEAKYTVWQDTRGVTIRAEGSHPELGWRTWFHLLPARDGLPQFALRCERPEGMLGQANTPFSVTTTLPTRGRVEEVIVHDARGPHRIPVTLVRSK